MFSKSVNYRILKKTFSSSLIRKFNHSYMQHLSKMSFNLMRLSVRSLVAVYSFVICVNHTVSLNIIALKNQFYHNYHHHQELLHYSSQNAVKPL